MTNRTKSGKMPAVMDSLVSLQDEVDTALKKTRKLKGLNTEVSALEADIRQLSIQNAASLKRIKSEVSKIENIEEYPEVTAAMEKLKSDCGILRTASGERRTVFARYFLGRIRLKMNAESDKLKLRDEYNKFKVRTAIIYVLFPLVVLFFHYYLRYVWKDTHWINMFYQLWLLYYYSSLSIRENLLVANGSNIRDWWLYHHYLAAFATIVLLVWPATEKYEYYVPFFTTFGFYNGVVMNMQNYYHKKREYVNRALGKIKSLDITYQETITEFPTELWLLLPFLLVAQLWEIVIGLSLLKTFMFDCNLSKMYWTEYREELQIFTAGVLQLAMGTGNMYATLDIVKRKHQKVKEEAEKKTT